MNIIILYIIKIDDAIIIIINLRSVTCPTQCYIEISESFLMCVAGCINLYYIIYNIIIYNTYESTTQQTQRYIIIIMLRDNNNN